MEKVRVYVVYIDNKRLVFPKRILAIKYMDSIAQKGIHIKWGFYTDHKDHFVAIEDYTT